MKQKRRRLVAAACLVLARPDLDAHAQQRPSLRILLPVASTLGTAVASALSRQFPGTAVLTSMTGLLRARPPTAYVAIGPDAMQMAAAQPLDAPLLSLLASRQAFSRVTHAAGRRATAMTAVHAEPAPTHQMQLIRAVFRRPVEVGVMVSQPLDDIAPTLQAAAARHGLSLRAVQYLPELGFTRNLVRLADTSAVLIFPDATVYTPQTLRELLETTYRRRQPVIGFSASLVSAGTLVSAYTAGDDLAVHAAQLVAELAAGRLPAAQYPRFWQVAVNDSVARSLDIVIDAGARQLGERP